MNRKLIILSLLLITFEAIAQKKVEIFPDKSVATVILSGKKDYKYYALSEKSKTEYKVLGPGLLTLNFRVRIEGSAFKSEPFVVKYIRSKSHVETIKIPELLSSDIKLKNKNLQGDPSRLQQQIIKVPPGQHTFRIYKYKTDQKAYVRAFYNEFPKPKWEDLYPQEKLDKKDVRFVKSGLIKSYFRMSKQESFSFNVKDSSLIRVVVRPEFSYNMLEETMLRIKLTNLTNGELKIYKVNSKKSNKIEFVSDSKMTPGTSSIFYIYLKKPLNGEDKYSLRIISGAKAAVIRISKDKNQLK
ncbi:MAG: hypothetical protein P1P88_12495 [Bacteroidales bacterium]|nr:hypothetical protein [Bacteroidales bacterium]